MVHGLVICTSYSRRRLNDYITGSQTKTWLFNVWLKENIIMLWVCHKITSLCNQTCAVSIVSVSVGRWTLSNVKTMGYCVFVTQGSIVKTEGTVLAFTNKSAKSQQKLSNFLIRAGLQRSNMPPWASTCWQRCSDAISLLFIICI